MYKIDKILCYKTRNTRITPFSILLGFLPFQVSHRKTKKKGESDESQILKFRAILKFSNFKPRLHDRQNSALI
jgi:hypothetical protein